MFHRYHKRSVIYICGCGIFAIMKGFCNRKSLYHGKLVVPNPKDVEFFNRNSYKTSTQNEKLLIKAWIMLCLLIPTIKARHGQCYTL